MLQERKPTATEIAMSVYDSPKYVPPRDAMKTEQVYRAPVSNNGGPNLRTSNGGTDIAQQIEAPIATISSKETLFDFNNTGLLKFKDTIGNIESANDYAVRGGFNDHYLGKYQLGKAFEVFTLQNHKYLERKSEKYRNLP